MPAISRHIAIEQGATWSQTFPVVDSDGAARNLTGYTARMQIRTAPGGGLIEEPTVAVTTAASGIITASLTAEETKALSIWEGVYDIEIVSGATVERVFRGCVRLIPEVTLSE